MFCRREMPAEGTQLLVWQLAIVNYHLVLKIRDQATHFRERRGRIDELGVSSDQRYPG